MLVVLFIGPDVPCHPAWSWQSRAGSVYFTSPYSPSENTHMHVLAQRVARLSISFSFFLSFSLSLSLSPSLHISNHSAYRPFNYRLRYKPTRKNTATSPEMDTPATAYKTQCHIGAVHPIIQINPLSPILSGP